MFTQQLKIYLAGLVNRNIQDSNVWKEQLARQLGTLQLPIIFVDPTHYDAEWKLPQPTTSLLVGRSSYAIQRAHLIILYRPEQLDAAVMTELMLASRHHTFCIDWSEQTATATGQPDRWEEHLWSLCDRQAVGWTGLRRAIQEWMMDLAKNKDIIVNLDEHQREYQRTFLNHDRYIQQAFS